ncbi:MAG: YjbE family putative metal transport protein, partial [Hyphomonadaceae bacterium]
VAARVQVILSDLALAGDNAIAVGLAAAALAPAQQKRAIAIGVALALALRVAFALVTVQLLAIKGLLLAGGLLLFWVAWRMWQDMRHHQPVTVGEPAAGAAIGEAAAGSKGPPTTFGRALLSIVIADVSMSLDNVLAVAGVSRHAPAIMAFGLILSVVLMGVAASFIAGVIQRFRWIATVGILIIVFAAVRMVWEDAHNFFPDAVPGIPVWLGGRPAAVDAALRFFQA